ncbi:Alpha/Beta hydrolase protein [Syncephalis pseudoplumigaleata]|uniref:Alpha/Beta hydrolase protein n=1 Tax=Syncephalis pseudoplumigaleata TaxID=1712513 RepID=A0A4P9Z5S5_9FUNG|nr:Alpha/Beta hydrolase protein [Syncephalis pseudoplumigaleata]|eukprot:RKP27161.1 Alpha/Beta hydrolase protein [Syncephalis pseudoplumigaleata]
MLGVRFDVKPSGTSRAHHPIPYAQHVAPHYRPPRNPIVLCHGLFGYDKMGPDALPCLQLHYWRGIKDALCRLGADVYVARVSGSNTIAKRAGELHQALASVLAGQEVNFIAHSMGGLDVRHLVTHLRPKEYRVRSLTTVSTPHRGSPFMDWCRDNLHLARVGTTGTMGAVAATASVKAKVAHALAPAVTNAARQMRPMLRMVSSLLDYPAYANLTTSYLTQSFNPSTPNRPDMLYFSYGAKAPSLSMLHVLRIPWEVVDAREGDNDGLVSVTSAHWGNYLGTLDADHWELNNCWRWMQTRKRANFDVMELYMSIATRLHQEGL